MTDLVEPAPGFVLLGEQPPISAFRQWWVLTARGVIQVFRNGEFIFALISPLLLAACFYLPLRSLVNELGFDYAQFLMPIIMLQSVAFVASSAAMRSALDGHRGVNERFRSLPMPHVVPVLARNATNATLLVVATVCGLAVCLFIGWRPVSPEEDGGGGVTGAVIAIAVVFIVGLMLAVCADGIGLVAKSPAATSQFIALPTLILGMLSTGFMPLSAFPTWIQGFAKNQPISRVVAAMNGAMDGSLTWKLLAPTVYWTIALAGVATVLYWISIRRAAQ